MVGVILGRRLARGVLLLLRMLMLRSLRLLRKRAVEAHGARINVAIGKRGVMSRARGQLPRPTVVLVVLIEVNELLVPNEEIADVHVSILWRERIERR